MENKFNRETGRALLLKLREAVNSQEEFEWVQAQLARLDASAMEVSHGMARH
jgi:hypothetical protein